MAYLTGLIDTLRDVQDFDDPGGFDRGFAIHTRPRLGFIQWFSPGSQDWRVLLISAPPKKRRTGLRARNGSASLIAGMSSTF